MTDQDRVGKSTEPGATPARLSQAVRAVETAGRRVPGGRPYEVEDEHFGGSLVWEVDVAAGRRLPFVFLVSADGRRVVRTTRARRLSEDARRVARARVTLAQALRIAGRRASGRFSEAEIDDARGGALVWEATFERSRDIDTKVVVDARSGRVLRVTTEHD